MNDRPDQFSRAGPLPFTLRQVEYFVATAEAGTISKAAGRLHASDSTVADALSAMEKTLNATLLNRRRSKGVTLTSDGLAILPIARRMLADAEELAAAVGRDPAAVVGPVRVGATNTLAPVVIAQLIRAMGERFPGVRIDFRTGDQPDLIEALRNSELDCLITFDIGVPPEFHRRPLMSTQAAVVLRATHDLAQRQQISLDELAAEPMILLDIEPSRTHTLELMSARGVTPRVAYRTDNYELCRSLVGRGFGYSLLMNRRISSMTWDGGDVRMVEIEPAPRAVAVLICWQATARPPRLDAVIRTALESVTDAAFHASVGE